MSLPLDFGLLESDDKFQQLCFRLAQKEFPNALPVSIGSWDGGRDVLLFNNKEGDVVWQCKFTKRNLSELKPKIVKSLDVLDYSRKISKWILCLSVDASGKFLDWLRVTIPKYPFIKSWDVWGREVLLERLDRHSDVLQVFFYPVWKSLESRFRTEDIELISYGLDLDCGWKTTGMNTLHYAQVGGEDNDLLVDIIVRNRGTIQSLIHSIDRELSDVRTQLRGLPGTALLWPQITYSISLDRGTPGRRTKKLEPPLVINAGEHQRFKLKLTDTGYAWTGYLRLTVLYGDGKQLLLPWTFLAV